MGNTEKQEIHVCKWVEELQERFEIIRDCVKEKKEKAKRKMKEEYDKKARVRELKEGSLVLLRVPGLHNKLDDMWDGPFEVCKRLRDMNYEVAVPNKRTKRKVVHVNNCEEWKRGEASVLRIVVAAEEDGDEGKEKLILLGDDLTLDQQRELQEVLNNFQDVMRDEPGLMKNIVHEIHTGDLTPCWTLPYRICPAWRE